MMFNQAPKPLVRASLAFCLTLGTVGCASSEAPNVVDQSGECVAFSVAEGTPREAAISALKSVGITVDDKTGLTTAIDGNIQVLYRKHGGKYETYNLPVGADQLAICVSVSKKNTLVTGPEDHILADDGKSGKAFTKPTRF